MPPSERFNRMIAEWDAEEDFGLPAPREFDLDKAYTIFIGSPFDWDGRRRPYVERALPELLADEECYSSGVIHLTKESSPSFQIKRRKILSDLWWYLKPNYRNSTAKGVGLKIKEVVVHLDDPNLCEPFGLHDLPTRAYVPVELTHNDNYTFVGFPGSKLILTGFQCGVFRLLHEASKKQNPWVYGPEVLADLKAGTTSLGDLFTQKKKGPWRKIVEQSRGYYRIRDIRSFELIK